MADNIRNSDNSIGYKEKNDALSIRIEAHKNYSNFSLEDWLDTNLPFREGDVILDIGCGNGNLFPVYSAKLGSRGVIVGIDQSEALLSEANNRSGDTPRVLLEWDMNKRFPFVRGTFDYVISTFAIYYAENIKSILEEIKRVLKKSGRFLLIGPTDNNARELYEFNKIVFGYSMDDKASIRTNRLKNEFCPVAQRIFEDVAVEKIESKLVFPDQAEFLRYYTATLLFEESVKKTGLEPGKEVLNSHDTGFLEVSKEMIALWGKK